MHASHMQVKTNIFNKPGVETSLCCGHVELAHLQELEEQLIHILHHRHQYSIRANARKHAFVLFHLEVRPGGLEVRSSSSGSNSTPGGTEGGGSDWNSFALNIRTTS